MFGNKHLGKLSEVTAIWQVIGASITGAAHMRVGKPCQDAILWVQEDEFAVLAVADGHGSAKSPYSDQGAQIAVEVAVELLGKLYSESSSLPNRLSVLKRYAEEQLAKAIVREWTDRVKKHHLTTFGNDILLEKELLVSYGSTLLAAILAQDFLLFLQLGDGDILAVSGDGQVTRPIPRDERLIANETTSLSTPHAWREMRVAFWSISDEPPALVLLSTDGYANSFVSEQDFLKVGTDYLGLIREQGIEQVAVHLEEWLKDASAQGSGDDITICLASRNTQQPDERRSE